MHNAAECWDTGFAKPGRHEEERASSLNAFHDFACCMPVVDVLENAGLERRVAEHEIMAWGQCGTKKGPGKCPDTKQVLRLISPVQYLSLIHI